MSSSLSFFHAHSKKSKNKDDDILIENDNMTESKSGDDMSVFE